MTAVGSGLISSSLPSTIHASTCNNTDFLSQMTTKVARKPEGERGDEFEEEGLTAQQTLHKEHFVQTVEAL